MPIVSGKLVEKCLPQKYIRRREFFYNTLKGVISVAKFYNAEELVRLLEDKRPDILEALAEDEKKIPEFKSEQEMAEFWDTHSVADYWDELERDEVELEPELVAKIRERSKTRLRRGF